MLSLSQKSTEKQFSNLVCLFYNYITYFTVILPIQTPKTQELPGPTRGPIKAGLWTPALRCLVAQALPRNMCSSFWVSEVGKYALLLKTTQT